MTREQAREAAAVMLAWADGKEVECKLKHCSAWNAPSTNQEMCFAWNVFDYRIKPTAKLRPWTADEVPVGAWIRSKNNSLGSLIIAVRPDGTFEISARRISTESALEQNEHSTDGGKTWLPCGVEEAK